MGCLIVAIVLLGGPTASARAQIPSPPADPAAIAAVVRLARALTSEDGGRLWGRSLAGPLLIVEPGPRLVWASDPDREGRLTKTAGIYRGPLPPDVNAANTALNWAGRRWIMVVWPLPADPADRRALLGHELWHRIQDSLGLPPSSPTNGQLDEEAGRVWLRLEARALSRALRGTAADRRVGLRDALGFRAARQRQYPGADTTETALERNEGLAQYTGLRLSGRPARDQRERAARKLAELEHEETVGRSFAYGTGPAYGLLLDQLLPGWRRRLGSGASFAVRALGPAVRLAVAAPGEAERYGEAAIRAEERARAERRAARRAELIARFVTGPVLRLPLKAANIGFDPGAVESLDSLGTIYRSARLTDAWGVLDAGAGAARVNRDWTEATVPVGVDFDGSALAGPGWRLELAKGWRIVPVAAGGWRLEPPG